MSLVEVERVSVHFPQGGGLFAKSRVLRAVEDVSFDIQPGETLALVGESGSGKTTLGHVVAGLRAPTEGAVRYAGQAIQVVFQDPFGALDPRMPVSAIIAEPLRIARRPAAEQRRRAGELAAQVGLPPDALNRYPHEFSGGQRQRIAIARALASEAEFLVADEPTSALDVSVQAQILNLMRDLQDRLGLTYLFISHNLAVVRHMANRIGVMYLGRIVEIGGGRELFTAPKHPYTRMLLDAVPDLAHVGRQRVPVQGEIPNPINPPSGCTFHPRCPFANERCKAEVPAFRDGVACHAVEEGRLIPGGVAAVA